MGVEVPDTYADRKDETVATVIQQTSEAFMRDSFMVETHPPLQPQSQVSQPTSLEIPETQSPVANPKKRELDSTTESQTSANPSNNTMSEPAPASAVNSTRKQADAITTSSKRLRLDQPSTITDIPTTIPPPNTTTIIADTQAAQPAPVHPLLPAQPPAQNPEQPHSPVAQKDVNDEDDGSGSDFEIPTIDPTMDTDEEESEEVE